MMRWLILAVLVIGITASATIVVQSLQGDSSPAGPPDSAIAGGTQFPVPPPKSHGPQPRAEVEGNPVFDIGKAAQQSLIKKDWVIRNVGQADLTLRLDHPPCSCTVTNFLDKAGKPTKEVVIKPKDSITIHTTWETREYSGKYRKTADVVTNDPEHQTITLSAEGEVYPAVVIVPSSEVNFVEISDDEEDHRSSVAIFSADHPEMKITKLATSKPDAIRAEKAPMTEEECKQLKIKAGYKITIHVNRGLPLGMFHEEVVIGTDHPKKSEMRVAVTGKMVGPITAVPDRVRLLNVPGRSGSETPINLLVRRNRKTSFEIEKKPEKLKVEVVPGDKDPKLARYRVIVTVPPGTPAGMIDDTIVLKTDHPQAKELRIPVHILVNDAG